MTGLIGLDLRNIPALDKIRNVDELRLVVCQSGKLAHVSIAEILAFSVEGILLSGDEQSDGTELILLSGDANGILRISE